MSKINKKASYNQIKLENIKKSKEKMKCGKRLIDRDNL